MLRKLLLFISILFLVLVLVWWLPQCSRPHSGQITVSSSNPPSSATVAIPEPAVDKTGTKHNDTGFATEAQLQEPPRETASLSEPPASSSGINSGNEKTQEKSAQVEEKIPPEGKPATEEKRTEESATAPESPMISKPGTTNPVAENADSSKTDEATQEEEPLSPTTGETGENEAPDTTPPEAETSTSAYIPPRVSGEGAASAGEALFQSLAPSSPVNSSADQDPSTIVLDGVSFAYNSDQLTDNSYSVLDNVAKSLKKNPDIHLEIAGYTDDRGEPLYNRILSRRRAEAVMIYLVEQGISAKRLTAVGYGSDNPIADNDTAEGRQQNRRVELHIKDTGGPAATSN